MSLFIVLVQSAFVFLANNSVTHNAQRNGVMKVHLLLVCIRLQLHQVLYIEAIDFRAVTQSR